MVNLAFLKTAQINANDSEIWWCWHKCISWLSKTTASLLIPNILQCPSERFLIIKRYSIPKQRFTAYSRWLEWSKTPNKGGWSVGCIDRISPIKTWHSQLSLHFSWEKRRSNQCCIKRYEHSKCSVNVHDKLRIILIKFGRFLSKLASPANFLGFYFLLTKP